MGHYDNCRPENCGVCGQLKGYCEHTKRKRASRAKTPKPIVSDEVTRVCTSRKSGNKSYETNYIRKIKDGKVWISYDRQEKADESEPFDLKTGNGLFDDKYYDQSILFDYGYEAQHQEDLFLGEGDTL